jgi:lipopolysaccharide transport system permease protein
MEYEIKPRKRASLGLGELWQFRELFYFFTWRDIRVKYKQTFLGFAWAVIQPFFLMLAFTLFFGKNDLKLTIPYPLFAFSGLILWNIFSTGIATAGNSVVANSNIIKKIYFPRLIIPVSSILVAFFDFLMTLPFLIGMLAWYHVMPSFAHIWMLPAGILLTVIATIGPGCLLAALNVKYRDFRYAIPFLVQFLLFVTPVIYPEHYIQNIWLQKLLALNPMAAPISLFRGFIIGQPVDASLCAISCFSALFFLVAGIYFFRKTENYFADLA